MLIYILRTDFCSKDRRLIKDNLLSHVLYENYGLKLSNAEIDRNEYGKPYLRNWPDIFFNISYSINFIACSIGRGEHGVDCEKVRSFDYYVAQRAFSKSEQQMLKNSEDKEKFFFSIWTLKECLGKAKGTGLNYDLRKTTFVINYDSISCSDDSFNYKTFELRNGYMLSTATKEAIEDIEIKEVVMENGELNNVRQSVQKI